MPLIASPPSCRETRALLTWILLASTRCKSITTNSPASAEVAKPPKTREAERILHAENNLAPPRLGGGTSRLDSWFRIVKTQVPLVRGRMLPSPDFTSGHL